MRGVLGVVAIRWFTRLLVIRARSPDTDLNGAGMNIAALRTYLVLGDLLSLTSLLLTWFGRFTYSLGLYDLRPKRGLDAWKHLHLDLLRSQNSA